MKFCLRTRYLLTLLRTIKKSQTFLKETGKNTTLDLYKLQEAITLLFMNRFIALSTPIKLG